MTAVPTIDLELAEQDSAERERLDAACRDHGFFLLSNHGMQPEIDAMWKASARFFTQSTAQKRTVLRTEKQPLGYYDRELTKRMRDQKEVFDFAPTQTEQNAGPRDDSCDLNQWPADAPDSTPGFAADFRHAMEAFTESAGKLAARTLELVFQSLNADLAATTDALPRGQHRTSNIRLNYYPESDPLSSDEASNVVSLGDMALHHHTDPGILTLLVQDMVGGLQTQSLQDGWIDVPPSPNTIVVNLGDAMQVWTNDVYRAAIHRVTPMDGQPRYSTPYFYNPAGSTVLEPLSALASNAAPKYRAFTWKEFIQARISDNYADLGEDDTQISNYKIA